MREIDRLAVIVAGYRAMLHEADKIAAEHPRGYTTLDPVQELRVRFPLFFATLSPEARGLVAEAADQAQAVLDALGDTIGHEPRLRLVGTG